MANPGTAPRADELTHLRASDLHGGAIIAAGLVATALALWLSSGAGWWQWALGQVLLAAVLVHWFAVLHECGHGTLFRRRRLNAIAGHLAGFLTMIPFRSWVRIHGRHHKWTGWQDLDPTTAALVPRPLRRFERFLVNACWRLWIPLFSTLYRLENYWHPVRLARLFPAAADRRALLSNAGLQVLAYAALVAFAGPWELARLVACGVILSLVAEDVLLLSQHTHIPQNVSGGRAVKPVPAVSQEVFTRSLRLPAWASTLLLHFDAHELHHMYPFVPGYHLRSVPYQPAGEIGWWDWLRISKRTPGAVLLFANRHDTGIQI
jgi:omega-6 fatty acid desaturase (delta-12 desaturase)